MHTSYLWNFVDGQDSRHVETDVRVGSPNDCYHIVLDITHVIGEESVIVMSKFTLPKKKFHRGKICPAFTKIAVIDVEAQGNIG